MMAMDFVRVAAATPRIRVADCDSNAEKIISLIRRADRENIRLLCMPELCLTGYTCGDLFFQKALLDAALAALSRILRETAECKVLALVGMPIEFSDKVYNVAAVFCRGKVLGFVPKTHIPNYGEFYEQRHFTPATAEQTSILFQCEDFPDFKLAVEICEDLWAVDSPGAAHAAAGATVIANLSASSETVGKAGFRRSLTAGQSARLNCGYIYADAGYGESTTDMVFSGHNLICENGGILAEAAPFSDGWAVSEIDMQAILHERRRQNTFPTNRGNYNVVKFSLGIRAEELTRKVSRTPFLISDAEEILSIQAHGLAKRLEHTGACAVLGVSGGLDSTLALLVTTRAYDILGRDKSGIIAVTMPCFGTTERTKSNAHRLCDALKIPCREIDITETVRQHLRDISHPEEKHDTTFENAQARIRTLVLMDLANQNSGIVIGSGNLSELALGWATYSGDHMSMYGVNAGVPKTAVRHIVAHFAKETALAEVLGDIIDTPVSPELLPPKDGEITQETETILGAYELHDFFLYHLLRHGRTPAQILSLAKSAFDGAYPQEEIKNRLELFLSRFFSQQFKRSCLPDGAKVFDVSLSPRGDWRMPSDAVPLQLPSE